MPFYSLKMFNASEMQIETMRHFFNRTLPRVHPDCFVSFGKIPCQHNPLHYDVHVLSYVNKPLNQLEEMPANQWSDEYIEQLQNYYHVFLWQHGKNPLHTMSGIEM